MDALYNAAKPRVVAIGGPTATGKTALSVALAKRFGGEIISADSMQIYQGLDVGTAKVTPEEMQGVPHHLVGFLAPEQAFSVADFTTLAGKTITQLTAQGKLPLVVGGTGLYITSLLNGIGFTPEKVDPAIRQGCKPACRRKAPRRSMQNLPRWTRAMPPRCIPTTPLGSSVLWNCTVPPAAR